MVEIEINIAKHKESYIDVKTELLDVIICVL